MKERVLGLKLNYQFYKDKITFANTDAGTIYIEANDKGDLIRLKNVDNTYFLLCNRTTSTFQDLKCIKK